MDDRGMSDLLAKLAKLALDFNGELGALGVQLREAEIASRQSRDELDRLNAGSLPSSGVETPRLLPVPRTGGRR
jgi:hypothetical protein